MKRLQVDGLDGSDPSRTLDASVWVVGKQMMVGIANGKYVDEGAEVRITLPVSVSSLDAVLYDGEWTVDGNKLSRTGKKGLGVYVIMLNMRSTNFPVNDSSSSIRVLRTSSTSPTPRVGFRT